MIGYVICLDSRSRSVEYAFCRSCHTCVWSTVVRISMIQNESLGGHAVGAMQMYFTAAIDYDFSKRYERGACCIQIDSNSNVYDTQHNVTLCLIRLNHNLLVSCRFYTTIRLELSENEQKHGNYWIISTLHHSDWRRLFQFGVNSLTCKLIWFHVSLLLPSTTQTSLFTFECLIHEIFYHFGVQNFGKRFSININAKSTVNWLTRRSGEKNHHPK